MFHLSLTGQNLLLTSTDLTTTVELTLSLTPELEGAFLLPARAVHDLVRRFPPDTVLAIRTEGDRAHITSPQARYTLPLPSAVDFPHPPWPSAEDPSLSVPLATLRRLVDAVAFAAATDDTKPILTAVQLRFAPEGLELCATDNFRLAWIRHPEPLVDTSFQGEALVPARSLQDILRLPLSVDSLTLTLTGHHLALVTPEFRALLSLLGGGFPDFRRVIPSQFATRCLTEQPPLLAALARLQLVTGSGQPEVWLHVQPDGLRLAAGSADVGTAEEFLPAEVEGPPQDLLFDHRLVYDTLRSLGDEPVRWEIAGPEAPVMLRPGDSPHHFAMVVPMRSRRA